MIEDQELRLLFQAESEERIKHLCQGLKTLEGNVNDVALLDELFRDAHTLKGAARMLDLSPIERIVHLMEDQFSAAKKGEKPLDLHKVRLFYEALDSVSALVDEAISGKAANVQVEELLARLSSQEVAIPAPPAPVLVPPNPPPEPEKVSTVRVNYQMIDDLSNQAAELIVIKNRMNHLQDQIDELTFMSENETLNQLRSYSYGEIHKLDLISTALVDKIKHLSLVPIAKLFDFFPRMVRDLSRALQKEVDLVMRGGEVGVDKRIVEQMKDPLMHLIRNAIDHGIESREVREQKGKPSKGKIQLSAQQTANHILFEVTDDGRGLDVERIREKALEKQLKSEDELKAMPTSALFELIFLPGLSTAKQVSDLSGRGVGLDVVKNAVEKLNGSLHVESEKDRFCSFKIELPMSVITTHILLVRVGANIYAVPIDTVESCALIELNEQQVVIVDQTPISVLFLHDLLNLPDKKEEKEVFPCLFVKVGADRFGILVDEILGEQNVVITPPSPLLKDALYVRGTTILATGKVCVLLNPYDIAKNLKRSSKHPMVHKRAEAGKKRLLYVDDSLAMQSHLRHVLEKAGYEVIIASNGEEGLKTLESEAFDAVVSDIDMPRMDGLTMAEKIRKKGLKLPLIFLTSSSSDENFKRADKVQAAAYLIKSHFMQDELLKTLREVFKA